MRWFACVVVVLAWWALSAPAHARWSAAETLEVFAWSGHDRPSVAVGPDGTAAVAWEGRLDSQVAVKDPGGSWSAPVPLGDVPGRTERPAVVVASDGGVLAVWNRGESADGSGLAFRYRPPRGVWGPARWALPGVVPSRLRLAIDAQDRVTALYERGDQSFHAVDWTRAGGWSAPVQVLPPYGPEDPEHWVSTRAGTAAVVTDDGLVQRLHWRAAPGEPFTQRRLTTVGRRSEDTRAPAVAPDGTLLLRWSEVSGSGSVPMAADVLPSGELVPVEPVPAGFPLSGAASYGWTADGRAIALASRWVPAPDERETLEQLVAERRAGGAWSAPVRAFAGASLDAAELLGDGGGRLHWLAKDADPRTGQVALRATVRAPDGTWSEPRTLSPMDWTVEYPALAAAGDHAAAAWRQAGLDGVAIRVATWTPGPEEPDAPPPPLPAPPAPLDHSAAFLADGARTARIEGAGLELPLRPAWSFAAPAVEGGAVVADELAYVFERPGADEGWGVSALDVATGQRRWHTPLGGAQHFPGGLALDAGVLVATARSGVWALGAEDGRVRWHNGTLDPWAWNPSEPAVSHGLVLAHYSGSGDTLYAFDAATGEREWMVRPHGGGPVTVGGGMALLSSNCGRSSAFALPGGERLWRRDETVSCSATASAFDGGWLWRTDGSAIDAASGTATAGFESEGPVALASPYAYTVDDRHRVVARHQRTLEVAWTFDPGTTIDLGPLLVDGVLYVASASGTDRLLAVDPASGELLWSAPVRGEVPMGRYSTLAAARGHLLVPVAGGVEAFRTAAPLPPEGEPPVDEPPGGEPPVNEPPGDDTPAHDPPAVEPVASGAAPPPAEGQRPRTRACRSVRARSGKVAGIRATGLACSAARRQARRLAGRPGTRGWRCVKVARAPARTLRCARDDARLRFRVRGRA